MHAPVLFFLLQDRSVEKVVFLLAIAKGKQLSIFIFLTRVTAGFLLRDVLLAFFVLMCRALHKLYIT